MLKVKGIITLSLAGTTQETIFGLKSLMFIFPAIVLLIGLVSMFFFPINKKKYDLLTESAKSLHTEKKEKITSNLIN